MHLLLWFVIVQCWLFGYFFFDNYVLVIKQSNISCVPSFALKELSLFALLHAMNVLIKTSSAPFRVLQMLMHYCYIVRWFIRSKKSSGNCLTVSHLSDSQLQSFCFPIMAWVTLNSQGQRFWTGISVLSNSNFRAIFLLIIWIFKLSVS